MTNISTAPHDRVIELFGIAEDEAAVAAEVGRDPVPRWYPARFASDQWWIDGMNAARIMEPSAWREVDGLPDAA